MLTASPPLLASLLPVTPGSRCAANGCASEEYGGGGSSGLVCSGAGSSCTTWYTGKMKLCDRVIVRSSLLRGCGKRRAGCNAI